MGPNVKFVSAITDAFSNKKNGGQFFSTKKTKPEGGSEGGLVKDHTFAAFFFCTLPLIFLPHHIVHQLEYLLIVPYVIEHFNLNSPSAACITLAAFFSSSSFM